MMTRETALELVTEYIKMYDVDEEYPLFWVGEFFKETSDYFFFEGAAYKEGENPKDNSMYYVVKKNRGECGMVAPPPGIYADDMIKNYAVWEDLTFNPRKMQ